MDLARRRFLKLGGAAAAAWLVPPWPRVARGAASDPVLLTIYLRGGADGLSLVVPADDPDYYALRPDIRVAPGDEIPLDGFFGLHPQAADLMPLFSDGDLAIVHAAGSRYAGRSHFSAQEFMERGTTGDPRVADGWLGRTLRALSASDGWSGISLGPAPALSLEGSARSLALPSLAPFLLEGSAARRAAIETLYRGAAPELLGRAADEGLAALDVIGAVSVDTDLAYPAGRFGELLRDAAALIRADVGVRVVAVDLGDWDHHIRGVAGMELMAPQLAAGLAALRLDLGAHWTRTAVLVMTEFGRTAAQNGSGGTDHGHGTVMLAAGGGVAGGRVITRDGWPGLSPGRLHQQRDLAVTTDFRDVFAELLHLHMGVPLPALLGVLPDHDVQVANFPGLTRRG